jgi:hypothetical protein
VQVSLGVACLDEVQDYQFPGQITDLNAGLVFLVVPVYPVQLDEDSACLLLAGVVNEHALLSLEGPQRVEDLSLVQDLVLVNAQERSQEGTLDLLLVMGLLLEAHIQETPHHQLVLGYLEYLPHSSILVLLDHLLRQLQSKWALRSKVLNVLLDHLIECFVLLVLVVQVVDHLHYEVRVARWVEVYHGLVSLVERLPQGKPVVNEHLLTSQPGVPLPDVVQCVILRVSLGLINVKMSVLIAGGGMQLEGDSEVIQLDILVPEDQEVLWLDIPVVNVPGVQVVDGLHGLEAVVG